jgi:hypothetical protein
VPWEALVGGRKNATNETRCTGIDVAVSTDKPCRDRAHPPDDALGAGLDAVGVWLSPAARTDPATPSAHWPGVPVRG